MNSNPQELPAPDAAQPDGAAPPRRLFGLAPPFDRLALGWLLLAPLVPVALAYAYVCGFQGSEAYFLIHQDLSMFALCAASVLLLGLAPPRWLSHAHAWPRRRQTAWVLTLAAGCFAVGLAGVWVVFRNYDFSLDEFMADFDARIFARGGLMAPVDPAWRPFASALQPMYLIPSPGYVYWASGYLPVNAELRAIGRLFGLRQAVNPLLSAVSVVAVYAAARQLWPQRPRMALGAAALLASSAQLLVMSMTAYAMPGHLALNLLWLCCFLRGGRGGHFAAILYGFLACGLHQLIFHPLFAAPFVLQLWLDRRWGLAGLYTAAYAAIALFWINYWPLELELTHAPMTAASTAAGAHFARHVLVLLSKLQVGAIGAMAESLIRFVTWQNVLTAPLALIGVAAALRTRGHVRSLALGVVLTIVAMLIFEPTQTHGWGYRYMQGVMGSVCLLAVWAWTRLTDGLSAGQKAAANGAFALACAVSLCVLTPLRAWQAWRYATPYAAANAEIRSAPAQVVIVDHESAAGFDPGTVVRNDPFLRNSPKVMELSYMTEGMVRWVCAHDSVQVFDSREAARLGIDPVSVVVQPRVAELRAVMAGLKCGRPIGLGVQS